MSGQLTSKIKIPKSQVELINLIFAELEITFHNQFHKAFPDEETLTLAKQLWLAKLEKYQNEIVFRAIDKIIETSKYLPSLSAVLNQIKELKDIPFKIAVEDDGKSFFKLTIKVREKIVADGLSENDYDVTNVGAHLTAKQWNKAIDDGAVVVDMRNHYESEIGRFKGAICPEVETFKEELPVVKDLLKGKESDQVLLYCTGGIRCEKASAYLKNYGFENVSQLHGGIIDYVRQINENNSIENKFVGKNFVFDERRAERISNDIISNCHQCGDPCDQHINCKNVNCNLLFLQCEKCKEEYDSCCSLDCIEVAKMPEDKRKKLRKGVENKKIYYSHKKVKLNLKA